MALNLLILRADVKTYHPTRSAGGLIQTCQHVHSCRLAGTVGSQESEYLASLNTERDVVYGMEITKGFHQMLHLNDVVRLFTLIFSLGFAALLCKELFTLIYAWRIEDAGKLGEDIIGSANTAHLPLVQKSDALATTHLVEIRR